MHPLTVLDVAHNAEGLAAALAYTRAQQRAAAKAEGATPGQLYVLLGLMRDKDLAAIELVLRRAEVTVLPVALDSPRACSAADLRAALADLVLSPDDDDPPRTPTNALAWVHRRCGPHDAVLCAGSHLVVEAILRDSAAG